MSTILAIETSSETASVALLHNGAVLCRQSAGVQTHSQTVLPMVQALLADAGVGITRCDAIAFGAGPGSFTGVRTACGVAQGLAFGAGLPVVPVVTLEALAQACFDAHPDVPAVLAMLDARMGELYWAHYQRSADQRIVVGPSLAAPEAVRPVGDFAMCGNGLAAYPEALAPLASAAILNMETLPHAAQVGVLGLTRYQKRDFVPPEQAQPLYLRNKVAQTTAERLSKVQP
jgi:tRNA threonylcarbamoyladenosine biosynthesis protein TsaB